MISSDRRKFIHRAFGGLAGVAAWPLISPRPLRAVSSLDHVLGQLEPQNTGDEAFWVMVKSQFPIRSDLVLMNAANLCPAPYVVLDAVARYTRDIDADASFQNRAKFDRLREEARTGLARYLGVEPQEIAITRNTSEGNNTVVNGIDLRPGDEVVLWDQNHPTTNIAWDVRAQRAGFTVRRVSTPHTVTSKNDLIVPFRKALTSRTRVLAFSHVSNVSGVALPVDELCALARERRALTLVDGAQAFGALRLDLANLGCDFYTASTHKWFVGPKEAGVLYVRKERVGELWASDVGVGWERALQRGAEKFENLGQRNDATVAAVSAATAMHVSIGPERIEARVHQLATAIKEQLSRHIPNVVFYTPHARELTAGVVVFRPPRGDPRELFDVLYHEHGIAGAPMSGEFEGVRLSPHIYNTLEEVDRVVHVLRGML